MSSNLDVFVTCVQQSSAQKTFDRLHDYVKNNSHMLQKHIPQLDTVLGILDMHEHSIGWLAVLVAKFSMPNNPDFEALFSKVRDFVRACNEAQIREASDLFATLCHKLRITLIDRKQALRGIVVLKQAITKMQNDVLQLTSVHSDLCLLCLEAKCYKPALTVLDLDMTDICKEKGAYEGKDFIKYYYNGGLIYTNVKNYERALYFYEQVITIPALSVHPTMEHAFKRHILVSLILHGKMQPLPKYTAQIIGRIKPSSSVYYEFAQVYTSNNHAELRGLVSKQGEMFKRDGTTDLVKQCLDSLNKKNIQRLTKTFLTLSLQDMASRVQLSGPQEAEKYVLNMIEDGEIYATINQKDGMVCFHDNPEKYNNPAMLHKIDQEMSKCQELDRTLKFFDRNITTSEQFVRKSMGPPEEDTWR